MPPRYDCMFGFIIILSQFDTDQHNKVSHLLWLKGFVSNILNNFSYERV